MILIKIKYIHEQAIKVYFLKNRLLFAQNHIFLHEQILQTQLLG